MSAKKVHTQAESDARVATAVQHVARNDTIVDAFEIMNAPVLAFNKAVVSSGAGVELRVNQSAKIVLDKLLRATNNHLNGYKQQNGRTQYSPASRADWYANAMAENEEKGLDENHPTQVSCQNQINQANADHSGLSLLFGTLKDVYESTYEEPWVDRFRDANNGVTKGPSAAEVEAMKAVNAAA